MVLIDISPPLRVGMGVFPGDAVFQTAPTFTIGPNCPVNVAEIAMSTHCGAHADAPLHYDPNGASIDQLDLADFIGPARVIDARGENPLCGFDDISVSLDGAPPRLLFRLMERLDPMVWPTGFRALAPEGNKDFLGDLLHLQEGLADGIDAVRAKEAGKPYDEAKASTELSCTLMWSGCGYPAPIYRSRAEGHGPRNRRSRHR